MIKDNFKTTSKDKIEFIQRLSNDDDLAKCLINNQSDFLNYSITDDDKDNLAYTKIFPYNNIVGIMSDINSSTEDTQKQTSSYITMKFRYKRVRGANIFKNANITFFLFCHKNLLKTQYNSLRYDYMLKRLDEIMNDATSQQWFGKMICDEVEDFNVDSKGDYLGVMVKYINTELM